MDVRKETTVFASICVGVLACGFAAGSLAAQQTPANLYQRMGGYDAIAALVDDFVGRLAADPKFARFFQGSSVDSRRRRRQLLVEQLCEAAGGPCYYTGRTMQASHRGLGITEAEWGAMMQHLNAALDKQRVVEPERSELLRLIAAAKKDIVEGGGP